MTGTVNSIGKAFTSTSGTLNFTTASRVYDTIPTVMIDGGTANFVTGISLNATTLEISGGTLAGYGVITVSGLTTITGGTISGSGDVNGNGGILLDPPGDTFFLDGRTLINPVGQTTTWSGLGSNVDMEDGAAFNNLGAFLAKTAGSFKLGSHTSSFNNQGSFTKSTGTGTGDFRDPASRSTSPAVRLTCRPAHWGRLAAAPTRAGELHVRVRSDAQPGRLNYPRCRQQHRRRRHGGLHRRDPGHDRHGRDLRRDRNDDRQLRQRNGQHDRNRQLNRRGFHVDLGHAQLHDFFPGVCPARFRR